jgi:hypothetical protein
MPPPAHGTTAASWRVLRQDDNGNTFVVADSLDEAAARRLAAELEAQGHKQLYIVEGGMESSGAPSPEVPPGSSGRGGR